MKKLISLIAVFLLAAVSLPAQTAASQAGQAVLNKKNLVIKAWNTNAKGTRILDHVTIFSPEGKKIEETEYDSMGKQKWRKRYEWGENGRMARELVYNESNRLVNYKKFEYNQFGKKKVQYTYDPKGRLIGTKVFEYLTQDA